MVMSLFSSFRLCTTQVVYNFAAIDPFNKGSTYFGKRLNVAYFSQFSAKFSLRE